MLEETKIDFLTEELARESSDQEIACIMNTLRVLKGINPGDAYYEAYQGHIQRCEQKLVQFFDLYVLLWRIGAYMFPRRILEIGTRTGISMCQLLSSYLDLSEVERIVSVDPYMDSFISPALVRKNLKHLNLPYEKVEFFVTTSEMAFIDLCSKPDRFDYILVDGDHSKEVARQDLESASKILAPGGIIVFDDISTDPGECGLIDVWTNFKENHLAEYQCWDEDMTGKGVAWAIKKGEGNE